MHKVMETHRVGSLVVLVKLAKIMEAERHGSSMANRVCALKDKSE